MEEGPLLKFETWAPDLSAIDTPVSTNVSNVLPRADGYGPVPSWQPFTQPLGAPCRGALFARSPIDGSVIAFAATAGDLWQLNNTSFSWMCVSKQPYGVITAGSFASGGGAAGSGYAPGTYNSIGLQGSTHGGGGVIVNITVNSTGNVSVVNLISGGSEYQTSDLLVAPPGALGVGGSGFAWQVTTVTPTTATPPPSTAPLNAYSGIPLTDNWQLIQFNNLVIACQQNSPPQKFVLGVSTYFADLSGVPPQASHVAVINQFVVMTGINNLPFRVQWSDFANPESWIPAVGLSNYQDMPDGGVVHDVRGSDQYGVIFQDAAIRMMSLAIGSQFTFQILRIASLDGIFGQYSSVTAGDKIFFCSPQGMKKIEPGGGITPIGKERIDRTFFTDIDVGSLRLFVCTTDPRSTRVYWMYKSVAGLTNLADKVLIYDWALDRWTVMIGQMLEYLFYMTKPGLTADGLDTIAPGIIAISGAVAGPSYTINGVTSPSVRLTLSALSAGTPPSNYNLGSFPGITITASISGTVLTVTATSGTILPQMLITVTSGATTIPMLIVSQLSGTTGGTGTYRVDGPPIVIASQSMPAILQLQRTVEPYGIVYGATGSGANVNNISYPYRIFDATHIDLIGATLGTQTYSSGGQIGGSLDQLVTPLDSYSPNLLPQAQLAAFAQIGPTTPTPTDLLGLFTGPNLEAILETPDQDLGDRYTVEWIRPLCDAPVSYGRIGDRDTPNASVNYTVENPINPQGLIPCRAETRYARAHLRIPAGQIWTFASGCKSPDAVPSQGVR